MNRTDAKGRGNSIIRQMIIIGDLFYQFLGGCYGWHFFPDKAVQNSAAGVFGLQVVLQIKGVKNIISKGYWQLSGVGIIRRGSSFLMGFFIGNNNVGKLLFVVFGKTVSGAFTRRGLQVVKMIGFLLIGH